MSSKGMSLKGRVNHYAKQNGIAAQVVLQNYMFERFLVRLSRSENNEDLKRQWARYQRQFPYAIDIPYVLLMESLHRILSTLGDHHS